MIFKKGTQVKVISGSDKGKTGEILEINKISDIFDVKIQQDASEFFNLLLQSAYPEIMIDLADLIYVQHERPAVYLNFDHIHMNLKKEQLLHEIAAAYISGKDIDVDIKGSTLQLECFQQLQPLKTQRLINLILKLEFYAILLFELQAIFSLLL